MALLLDFATLFGIVMLGVGLLVALVSLRYVWRTIRLVRAPSASSLEVVDAGDVVRFEGTAVASAGEGVVGPFSGRETIALRAAVEERRPSVVIYPWDVTLWEAERGKAHGVRTPEGEVSVGPAVRTVVVGTDHVTSVDVDSAPPEHIEDFVSNTEGISRWTFWSDPPGFLRPLWRVVSLGRRRYLEQALEDGDEVTVVGRAKAEGGLDPIVLSDRGFRATLWRMARTSFAGLAIGFVGLSFGTVVLLL